MGVTAWMKEERDGKTNGDWCAIQGNDLHSQPRRSIIIEGKNLTMKHNYITGA